MNHDFFTKFPQEVINYFDNDACSIRNQIANPKGIINYMNIVEETAGPQLSPDYNQVGVMSIFVVLNPIFIVKKDNIYYTSPNDTIEISMKRKNKGYSHNKYNAEQDNLIGFEKGTKRPIFKILPKYYNISSYRENMVYYMKDNQGFQNVEPEEIWDAQTIYYTYQLSPSDAPNNIKVDMTPGFENMRYQVYLINSTTRTYLNMLDGTDPNAALHSAHIWFASYGVDRGARTSTSNIMDSNSIHSFNFDYLRYCQYIINENYDPRLATFEIIPNITKQYVIDGQLQNNEVWGLCQSFALTFYTVALRQPSLALTNMNRIFTLQGYRDLFFNVGKMINSGKYMTIKSKQMEKILHDQEIEHIMDIDENNHEEYMELDSKSPKRRVRSKSPKRHRRSRSKSPRRRRSRSKSPKRRRK